VAPQSLLERIERVAIEAHGIAEPQDLDILLADDLP